MGADWVYYDGTGSPKLDGLGNQLYVTSTTEIGDRIQLGNATQNGSIDYSTWQYGVTKFQFEYYATGVTTASPISAKVNLYNGNPSGSAAWSSASFNLKNGYNSVTIEDAGNQFATVNGQSTWSVSFGTLGAGQSFGLLMNGDPTIGANGVGYWAKTSSGWESYLIDGGATAANFSARVTAVPEPTTISLGLLALGALGYAGFRRR